MVNEGTALGFNQIGDIKDKLNLNEGSAPGAFLHGVVGCLSSEASGGNCGAGFVTASVNELVSPLYDDGFITDPNATAAEQEQARKTYELQNAYRAGVLLGAATSGGDVSNIGRGSGLTISAVQNNRQLHVDEAMNIRRYANEYAVQQGYCETAASCSDEALTQAKAELTAETLRGVSDDFSDVKENAAARDFLNSLQITGDQVDGQTLFGVLDRNSTEYRNSTINMAGFNNPDYLQLYTKLDRVPITADGQTLDPVVWAMRGVAHGANGGTDLVDFSDSYSAADLNDFLTGQNGYAGVLAIQGPPNTFDHSRDRIVLQGVGGDAYAFGKEGLRTQDVSDAFLNKDYFGENTTNYLYLNNIQDAENILTAASALGAGKFQNVKPKPQPADTLKTGNVPNNYRLNTDGTITGPQGATYRPVSNDANGNPVYQRGDGSYHTFESGRRVDASNPNPNASRQSEQYVQEQVGVSGQVSYKDGKIVSNGTAGSVRPDCTVGTCAIEVKNYNLSRSGGQTGLINTTSEQLRNRANHLPEGMAQEVRIDITDQNVSLRQRREIAEQISIKSGGVVDSDDIQFFTRN